MRAKLVPPEASVRCVTGDTGRGTSSRNVAIGNRRSERLEAEVGDVTSADDGIHLLGGELSGLVDGLVYDGGDEVLEHLDVFRIDDAGADFDGFDAGSTDADGCFGCGLGDLILHLSDLLLHRLLLHRLGLPKHVAVHHVVRVSEM